MSIKLSKGNKINLNEQLKGSLKEVFVGLGWDVSSSNQTFDLDTSAFMLGKNGRLPKDDFFVYYNNLIASDGSLEHHGDNRTGLGEGDDETILVKLNRSSPDIQEILFVVSIHNFEQNNQHFGQVQNAYIRLFDLETKQEIVRYQLNQQFSAESAVAFAKLYRKGDDWFFVALGEGTDEGLEGFLEKYM